MKQLAAWLVGLALTVLLVAGIARLFSIRIEAGDVYPPYSTLRTDPVGAKAFIDALAESSGIEARRSFREDRRDVSPAALFMVGLAPRDFHISSRRPLERIALGSRAIITLLPERAERSNPIAAATPVPGKKKTDGEDDPDEDADARISLAEVWGVELDTFRGMRGAGFRATAVLKDASLELEPELRWHSPRFFTRLGPGWRVIYEVRGQPVLIERPWGNGSVVLVADSYLLSNEALHGADRAPRLLAWLIGAQSRVIFDERHHGIREQGGVVALIARYRLHGLLVGLLLLVLLYVWQEAAPFAPKPASAQAEAGVVLGRSADEGLIALLRRSLPTPRLLETCIAEWRASGAASDAERRRVEAAWGRVQHAAHTRAGAVAAYRELTAAMIDADSHAPARAASQRT